MTRRARILVAASVGLLIAAQALPGNATVPSVHQVGQAQHVRVATTPVPTDRVPNPVAHVRANVVDGQVHLSWTAPSAAARIVVRRVAGTVAVRQATQGKAVADLSGRRHDYTDATALPAGRYAYSVFAESAHGTASVAATAMVRVSSTAVTSAHVVTGSSGPALTGLVTDAQGSPLAGVVVSAYAVYPYVNFLDGIAFTGEGPPPAATAITNSAGTFRLTGLTTATFQICADGTQQAITGGHDDAAGYPAQCQQIGFRSVTASMPIFALAPGTGGMVTGTVTGAGNTPVSGAQVLAYTSSTDAYLSTTTDTAGHYLMYVTAGPVKVCSSGGTGGGSLGYQQSCAATSAVATDQAVTVNVVAQTGAAVTGTLTAATDGTVVPGAEVDLEDTSGNWIDSATTNASGGYAFSGESSGSYQLCSGGAATASHPTGFATTCTSAITVQAGKTTAAPALALANGGAISGQVTQVGAVFANVDVEANGINVNDGGVANTDSTGSYLITGLTPGSYQVCFFTSAGSQQCYNGQANGSSANPVVVAAGAVTNGVNAAFTAVPVGSLKVTATDAAGHGIVDVNLVIVGACPANASPYSCGDVTPYSSTTSVSFWQYLMTNAGGSATQGGLPAGKYAVCAFTQFASGGSSTTGYANGCSGKTLTISVATGKLTSYKLKLAAGAVITGKVTDPAGRPVAGAVVSSSLPGITGWNEYGWYFPGAVTAADGTYQVTGLTAGQSTICFDSSAVQGPAPTGYLDQCYNATSGTPTPVTVSAGVTTSGVNATLGYSGAVSGTVTNSSGKAVYGAEVEVQSTGNTSAYGTFATTNPQGAYTVQDVPAGTYSVCFSAYNLLNEPATGYVGNCYNKVVGNGTPTTVTVTNGVTTGGINSTLAAGAVLQGTVTVGGAAASSADVEMFSSLTEGSEQFASTASNGSWSITGLAAGTYYVCATANNVTGVCYSKQTWNPNGSTLPAKSKAITLKAGQTTTVSIALPAT